MDWFRRVIINNMKSLLKISFLFLLLAACQGTSQGAAQGTTQVPIPPPDTAHPTETLSLQVQARQNEITSIWQNGAHARASDPVNCEECHAVDNGVVSAGVSWLNQQTGQVETASSADTLCAQCHEHISVESAHMTFTCTDCHDPHKVRVSCTDSGCHSTIPTIFFEISATPTGGHPANGSSFCGGANCHSVATAVAQAAGSIHGAEHAQVSCGACHDASLLQTGPSPDDGKWQVWQDVDEDGEPAGDPHLSHNLQLEVDCARCHFEGNPWGLNLVTGTEFWK
jgi:hypothetical protein